MTANHSTPRPVIDRSFRSPWTLKDTIIVLLLVALAAFLRSAGLNEPDVIIFDETYYAKDACLYLGWGQEFCDSPFQAEQSYVHPPVGKWLIAAGEAVFGYNSLGWRVSAAIFGTAMVPFAYLLAKILFRTRTAAAISGFLVATDFLLIVQSRVAMLDIFLAFFVLVGFTFLAMDREGAKERSSSARLPYPDPLPEREFSWRLAAGIAFGLALSTKWSGGLALAAAGCLVGTLAIELARAESSRKRFSLNTAFRREMLSGAFTLVLIPLMIYLASYSIWFAGEFNKKCQANEPNCNRIAETAASFIELQESIFNYHWELEATHPYQSKAWTWPLVIRPVAYHYVGPEDAPLSHHIMAFGNPVVWYAALIASAWLIIGGRRRWSPHRFVLVGWGSQYLPWLAVPRALFFFYMTPAVPFMMIGLGGALAAMKRDSKLGNILVWTFLVIGVGVVGYLFYPILTGGGLPYDLWRSRMWRESWI